MEQAFRIEDMSMLVTSGSVPWPRIISAERKTMRTIAQPAPSLRCNQCDGELRLTLIEADDRGFDPEYEIFVCANCSREHSFIKNHEMPWRC